MQRFEDMKVWQDAKRLAVLIYKLTSKKQYSRDFGLRDQMRDAAVSVMSNISEGFESRTQLMFIEYLGRAKASAGELRAQLHLSLEIGYLEQSEFEGAFSLAEECSREIRGLMRYLETKPNAPRIRRGDTRKPPTESSSEA